MPVMGRPKAARVACGERRPHNRPPACLARRPTPAQSRVVAPCLDDAPLALTTALRLDVRPQRVRHPPNNLRPSWTWRPERRLPPLGQPAVVHAPLHQAHPPSFRACSDLHRDCASLLERGPARGSCRGRPEQEATFVREVPPGGAPAAPA